MNNVNMHIRAWVEIGALRLCADDVIAYEPYKDGQTRIYTPAGIIYAHCTPGELKEGMDRVYAQIKEDSMNGMFLS